MRKLKGSRVAYVDDGHALEGYLVTPSRARDLPGVLVAPSWLNVAESTCRRADRLAEEGFAVFVADLLGAGVLPAPPQSPDQVVAPFLADRLHLRRRLLAGLAALQDRVVRSPDRVAAIGYCLGGCGVLEIARAGAPLRGVVCLHGMLTAPIPAERGVVRARVLVLHGDADPLASFADIGAFREEMDFAGANWEIDIYGGARHAFTGEGIADGESDEAGVDPQAEQRSWEAMLRFLEEVLRPAPANRASEHLARNGRPGD